MSEEASLTPQAAAKRKREYRRYVTRRKVCAFCADKIDVIDYKDVGRLRRYLSDRARIEPRRKTGTCAKHQRMLSRALKRARHLALLPFTGEQLRALLASVAPGRPTPTASSGSAAPAPSPPESADATPAATE